MVQMDAAPVSTAAVASSRPREHPEAALQHETDHNAWGGLYNDFQVRDPIESVRSSPSWRVMAGKGDRGGEGDRGGGDGKGGGGDGEDGE